jgi:hypothetical protein
MLFGYFCIDFAPVSESSSKMCGTSAGDGEVNEEEFYRIMKKTSLF